MWEGRIHSLWPEPAINMHLVRGLRQGFTSVASLGLA
jgi:hypothetical protein